MTSFDPFDIGFYLDKRQESKTYPGHYTLYLRVHSNLESNKKYFSTKKYLTEFTWNRIKKSFLGSGSSLTVDEKELREFLLTVRQEAQKYNDPLIAKTLKQFEDLFKRNTKSNSASIFVYDIFEMVIDEKNKKGTKDAYINAMKSFKDYENNQKLVIHDISKGWIEGFRLWHKEKGSSKETPNTYLRALRHVFTHAINTGVILPTENPFGIGKVSIPEPKRRTKKFNLTAEQIEALAEVEASGYEEQLAKDVFFFLFMFDGIRISDMYALEKEWIVEDDLGKRIDFDPVKTEGRSSKEGEVWITEQMEEIIAKYLGEGKYVFNFLKDEMTVEEITKYRAAKTSVINKNLKKLALKIEGMPPLSTKHARYSAASYIKRKTKSTTEQISELLVNSPKMARHYWDTPEEKKRVQLVLSNVLKKTKK